MDEYKRNETDWLSSYIKYTEQTEPTKIYHEWVGVASIAAALRRNVRLEFGFQDLFPNFYIVLVGPPGKCRKGTAMGIAAQLLRSIRPNGEELALAAEATTREALIRNLANSARVTGIASGKGLSGDEPLMSDSSLTVFSEELTVFLGYNNPELLSNLCNWFDCPPKWKYETKNKGVDHLHNVWLNLIGATTPELIQRALPRDAVGGGFTSRTIFVYQDKRKFVPMPIVDIETRKLGDRLKEDLQHIGTLSGDFKWTDKAMSCFMDWRASEEFNPSFNHYNFEGYQHRKPIHLLKLAMIMSVSRSDSLIFIEEDFLRAMELIRRTEVKMPRTFSGYGDSDTAALLERMMGFIAHKEETTRGELMLRFRGDLSGLSELNNILEALQTMRYIKKKMLGNGDLMIEFNPNFQGASMYGNGQVSSKDKPVA